jgi:hypothetical protein
MFYTCTKSAIFPTSNGGAVLGDGMEILWRFHQRCYSGAMSWRFDKLELRKNSDRAAVEAQVLSLLVMPSTTAIVLSRTMRSFG